MECIIASFQIHLNELVSIAKPELYCDVVECDTHCIVMLWNVIHIVL